MHGTKQHILQLNFNFRHKNGVERWCLRRGCFTSITKVKSLLNNSQCVSRLHFSQCVPPLLLSTQTVCMQPKPVQIWLVNTVRSTNRLQVVTKTLPIRKTLCPFCNHMQISVCRDCQQANPYEWNVSTTVGWICSN